VTLANLGMWVRDHYFPASYARASWHRLQVFFQLPGRIFWGRDRVEVELKRFNDRALNRDLEMLCAKVAQEQPCLPDGRRLLFQGVSLFQDYTSRVRLSPFALAGRSRHEYEAASRRPPLTVCHLGGLLHLC